MGYRMFAGRLILANVGSDASGSGIHPTTFGITLARRNVVRAVRHEVVTRVLGTFRYLCVRAGQN
jgi:hypothetical protein